jgi:hypothetical protein
MKRLYYILILLCTIIGCKEQTKNIPQDSHVEIVEKMEGLTQLSEQWTREGVTFWQKDSTWKEIQPIDTLKFTNYTMTERYQLKLQNNLTITKYINIDRKSKIKISETDLYARQINPNIESRLGIRYNYKTGEYYANFLDSTGTNEKIRANRTKADRLLKSASKDGLYLCGTAYNEILWEDIPELPVPREIDKDSALFIIEQWVKK